MKSVARKKIVLVIVEGPSDESALGVILNRIYGSETVHVHVMHYDITSERRVSPNNIISKIGNVMIELERQYHFTKKDYKEIIHIVDMDGAYISDDNVVEDFSVSKPIYSVLKISTQNKQNIENRNHRKSDNIDKLCNTKQIRGVSYRVFYMSCNLDHVLYNKLNSSDEEKESDAYNFAKKYENNIPEFLKFISESDFSVVMGYNESWEFIKEGLHSLERYTNLGLCLKNNDQNKD